MPVAESLSVPSFRGFMSFVSQKSWNLVEQVCDSELDPLCRTHFCRTVHSLKGNWTEEASWGPVKRSGYFLYTAVFHMICWKLTCESHDNTIEGAAILTSAACCVLRNVTNKACMCGKDVTSQTCSALHQWRLNQNGCTQKSSNSKQFICFSFCIIYFLTHQVKQTGGDLCILSTHKGVN